MLIGLHFLHWWLFGETVTPLEPSEAMQTVELGRLNAGFLLFAAVILSTLIFGRWFCGWACHLVALQDLSAWLLGRLGLAPRPLRSRLLILAPWVVAFHMFAWPIVLHWWDPVQKPLPGIADWEAQMLTADLWETFPKWIMAPLSIVVLGFLIVWWLGAKGFCTHGCPYGAFFATADRFAPMRIVVSDACEKCGHCTSVCSSNVRVHEEVARYGQVVDPGCMKCLDCVSVCPKDALSFGKARPKPFVASQQRIKARADFTWPEEIALAVVAVIATQWTFRGAWFGEAVPFLLSVGLGAITAALALALWRLLRRPGLTFQHTALKVDGRLTSAGRLALVGLASWLLFAVHTFAAQRLKNAAIDDSRQPLAALYLRAEQATPASIEAAVARLPGALAKVDTALAFDLIDDPWLLEYRGLLLHAMDRHVEAEAALMHALADRAGLHLLLSNVVLARYCMDPARQRYDQAQRLLEFAVAHHPGDTVAASLLQQLQNRPR
ncbi:MAG: 4Fe-4S binding protein [Planctomycetes bacterium]|nr:4Fe-4S binding protein [Planctomycetota bacterium]